jgi:hypothetical protein
MEFLATVPIYTYPWIYNLLLAIAVITIVGGIMSCIAAFEMHSYTPALVGLVLIIAGFFGTGHTTNAMERTSVLEYNTYKVILNETITAREFLDKYEFLSREGEIFTIKEIEVDKE